MEAVDVFFRADRRQHFVFVNVLRKRQLHENAVDLRIVVQFFNQRKQFGLRVIRRKTIVVGIDSDLRAGLLFRRHV